MIDTELQILRALESADYITTVSAIKLFYKRHLATNKGKHEKYMLQGGFSKTGTNVYDSIVDRYGERWFVDRAREVRVEQPVSQQQPVVKVVTDTEANGLASCPKCGDTLQRFSICPSCKAASAGFKFKYLCACGAEFVTEREL